MQPLLSIMFMSLQITYFLYVLYNTGITIYKSTHQKSIHLKIVEISLFILLIFCFVFYELSGFNGQTYFPIYTVLTVISALCYWLNKIPTNHQILHFITLMFTSTLLWISVLTSIKFLPYLPFIWFPVYGILAFAPILFIFLTYGELYTHVKRKSTFKITSILLIGIVPLLLTYLTLVVFRSNPNEFIELFTPVSNII